MSHRRLWTSLALAAALVVVGAGVASANSITVPNGLSGQCTSGNPNTARFVGNCGALVSLTGVNTPAYVQDNSPNEVGAGATYRARLYVNARGLVTGYPHGGQPDSVPLLSLLTDDFDFFAAYDGDDPTPPTTTGTPVIRLTLSPVLGSCPSQPNAPCSGNELTAFYRTDAGEVEIGAPPAAAPPAGSLVGKFLPAGWREVEVRWQKSNPVGGNNGRFAMWVDGVLWVNATGLDIDTPSIKYARWGAVGGPGLAAGPTGSMRMDAFVSQRTGYVGAQAAFSDVSTGSPFFPFIQGGYGSETMPESAVGTFSPTTGLTRGSMARIILKGRYGSSYFPPACNSHATAPNGASPFLDVACPGHPEADWIYELAHEGITAGCGSGNYCPSQTLTRAQMIPFLYAARAIFYTAGPPGNTARCSSNGFPSGSGFTDVPDTHFACAYIARAKLDGLTGGCNPPTSTLFCPNNIQQKDQMSVFMVQNFSSQYNPEIRRQDLGAEAP